MTYLKDFPKIDQIVTALENGEEVKFNDQVITYADAEQNHFSYGEGKICYFINCERTDFIFTPLTRFQRFEKWLDNLADKVL